MLDLASAGTVKWPSAFGVDNLQVDLKARWTRNSQDKTRQLIICGAIVAGADKAAGPAPNVEAVPIAGLTLATCVSSVTNPKARVLGVVTQECSKFSFTPSNELLKSAITKLAGAAALPELSEYVTLENTELVYSTCPADDAEKSVPLVSANWKGTLWPGLNFRGEAKPGSKLQSTLQTLGGAPGGANTHLKMTGEGHVARDRTFRIAVTVDASRAVPGLAQQVGLVLLLLLFVHPEPHCGVFCLFTAESNADSDQHPAASSAGGAPWRGQWGGYHHRHRQWSGHCRY